jgi:hypothetical protein
LTLSSFDFKNLLARDIECVTIYRCLINYESMWQGTTLNPRFINHCRFALRPLSLLGWTSEKHAPNNDSPRRMRDTWSLDEPILSTKLSQLLLSSDEPLPKYGHMSEKNKTRPFLILFSFEILILQRYSGCILVSRTEIFL